MDEQGQPKRRIYLRDLPMEEARTRWWQALRTAGGLHPLEAEPVSTEASVGRVTAGPVYVARSVPHYHACAVDGVAIRAADSFGASETTPVRLGADQYAYVDTGDPLPDGFDAVVMIEDVHELTVGEPATAGAAIELVAPVPPWDNVRTVGEDMVAGELLLPTNHRIRPVDIGAMLAAGVLEVRVRRRPRLLIVPTGDELVEPAEPPKPGDVVEFNGRMLAAMAQAWGADAVRHAPVPDDLAALVAAIEEGVAARYDAVVINAGSSAGSRDLTAAAIERLGEVVVHGVRIKPGKPTVLGRVGATPVVGIPGYPVTAALTFRVFVQPLVWQLSGIAAEPPAVVRARLTRRVTSAAGVDEFVRVKLGVVGEPDAGGRLVATPMARGAGVLSSLVRADGLLVVARTSEGFEAGQEVEVELLRPRDEVHGTVVVVGSHDVALDVLGDLLRQRRPELSLACAHVGSLGGLMALRRGEAHMSGIHLLDPESGEYNLPYVRRYLPKVPVVLVTLAHRDQGLMVAPGNPKRIHGPNDLARPDVHFVNRQRGAGTRVLLDFLLQQAGIDPATVQGYERELFTHTAVAAAVAGGTADAGLGILAAARALGLAFIPLARERYDLVIPTQYLDSPRIQAVLDVLRSDAFRVQLAHLGGYDTAHTGQVVMAG